MLANTRKRLTRLFQSAPVVQRRARRRDARRYVAQTARSARRWARDSRETTNYTYSLTDRNVRHLAAYIAAVTRIGVDESLAYIEELHSDKSLAGHVRDVTVGLRRGDADPQARYGRRAGWYAIVRALAPALVVETGVDKGLGSVVLAALLLRNRAEGSSGRYVGVDIDPGAGWLFSGEYLHVGEIVCADSLAYLENIDEPIDVLICDAAHDEWFERREYELAERNLTERAVLISDTAHHSDVLMEHAAATGRRFLYFQERPHNHWYPGAGIGTAFR